jgi:hypothetical protein
MERGVHLLLNPTYSTYAGSCCFCHPSTKVCTMYYVLMASNNPLSIGPLLTDLGRENRLMSCSCISTVHWRRSTCPTHCKRCRIPLRGVTPAKRPKPTPVRSSTLLLFVLFVSEGWFCANTAMHVALPTR